MVGIKDAARFPSNRAIDSALDPSVCLQQPFFGVRVAGEGIGIHASHMFGQGVEEASQVGSGRMTGGIHGVVDAAGLEHDIGQLLDPSCLCRDGDLQREPLARDRRPEPLHLGEGSVEV